MTEVAGSPPQGPLMEVRGLGKVFARPEDILARGLRHIGLAEAPPRVHALADVNLSVLRGEVLGVVGESGCGKSTLGRILTGLMPATTGSVSYRGSDIARDRLRGKRGLGVQMVFQNPHASLNGRKRVGEIIGEGARVHGVVPREDLADHVTDIMKKCGLDPSWKRRYPHQFSGGQRQRINIARALAVKPDLIVCDEPVSALDVSVQAQILNLFLDLRQEFGLSYLFISHDLGVVRHVSDRVAVMYLGRVVELGPAREIFSAAAHPYTRALVREVPSMRPAQEDFRVIDGEIPSPLAPPPGCTFHPRCPLAQDRCRVDLPALRTVSPGHQAACHLL